MNDTFANVGGTPFTQAMIDAGVQDRISTSPARFLVGDIITFTAPSIYDYLEITGEIVDVTTYAGNIAYEINYLAHPDGDDEDAGLYMDHEIELAECD